MSKCLNKTPEVLSINDVDIDDLSSAPDYFLGMREIEDTASGDTDIIPVRVPGAKVMPTGNLANVIALETNNDAITVPDNQVRAGYMDVQPGGVIMKYADTDHAAEFLMLGAYTNGKMLIQSTGFLRIPAGHSYIVGTQYYLDDDGEPTTDNTVTGQKLFKPLDDYVLMVNGAF